MFLRKNAHRSAARLSAAIRKPTQALIEPLENRRLLSGAGQFVPTFGSSSTEYDAGTLSVPLSTVVQPGSGKTVVLTAYGSPVLARYNVDGSLDTTFGNNGYERAPLQLGEPTDMTLGPGDKLLLVGGQSVARLNADGSLDTTFGGTGYVATAMPAAAVAYDPTHDVIDVVGSYGHGAINGSGSHLEQFSAGGAVNWTTGVGISTTHDLIVRAGGKILVIGGNGLQGSQQVGTATQFNSDGTLDPSISEYNEPGNGGYAEYDKVVGTADGWFAIAGTEQTGNFVNVYRADGSPAYAEPVYSTAIALTASHQLVVGVINTSGGDDKVERFNADGTLDASFGNDGVAPNPLLPNNVYVVDALTIGPDGQLTVVAHGGRTPTAPYTPEVMTTHYTADSTELPFPASTTTPPGVVGVHQAEGFDIGGQGVAFGDSDLINNGRQYRDDSVDIETTTDAGGGYDVGYTHAGEYLNYTLSVPTTGSYTFTYRVANVGTGGAFHLEVDGVPVSGTIAVPDTGGFQNFVDLPSGAISLTAGTHVFRIVFDGNSKYGFAGNVNSFNVGYMPADFPFGVPFGQTPFTAGQTVQAENYNLGTEGQAYHDTDPANLGGQYRTDGVDIETTSDTGGGYDVGWTHTGEYLYYLGTFTAGTYSFSARVANAGVGGSFHVNVDGQNVTGELAVPDTGGFQNWKTLTTSGISLAAGAHNVQIVFDGQSSYGFSGNLNSFAFTPSASSGEGPFNNVPASLPGTVQAENFDTGGEGVAYHDTDGTNQGGAYRTAEGVDIEAIAGGYAVDYTHAGEWLKYTVNVATPGTYTLDARVADYGTGGAFHVEVDGVNVTGTLAVPNTGSFTTFADVTQTGVALTAGQHVVRIVWDANSQYGFAGNLDSFRFA